MITEIAIFTAVDGKEDELGAGILKGLHTIRQHPSCIEARVERCIEHPTQFMVMNTWTTLEAHTRDFRGSPLFAQWRSHITGLFDGQPVVFHYQALGKE